MTRWIAVSVVALLCLGGSSAAQDDPPAQAAIGRVLNQARDSGALKRVLGERFFTCPVGGPQALTTARGRLEGEGQEQVFVYEIEFWIPRPGSGAVQLECQGAIDFDGALRRLRMRQRMGQTPWQERALVPSEALPSYGADVVPLVFAAFFLAPLQDQGLPPALEGRPLHEMQLALGEGPLKVTSRKGPDVDGSATLELYVDLEAPDPRLEADASVKVAAAGAERGQIVSATMDGQKTPYEPLSAERAQELRDAAEGPKAERED